MADVNYQNNGRIATIFIDNKENISFDSYYYVTGNDDEGEIQLLGN
jgi:hypothetical protein